MGLAIAAMTTAAFMWGTHEQNRWAVIVGIPSLVVGTLWAAMLRRRETIGTRRIPVGWVLSVPLAALNGSLACAMLLTTDSPSVWSFAAGAVLGATFGVMAWAPGLALVLVLFGLPIAHARGLAKQGLAGEDNGERVVGLACMALGLASWVLAPTSSLVNVGALLFYAFAGLAVLTGATAAGIALRREARRRRFIARVEADEVPGFRVEERVEGKRLVRAEPHIETYRIAPQPDEELFELDSEGRVMRALC